MNEFENQIKKAIKMVEDTPEVYKQSAFKVILFHLLSSESPINKQVPIKPSKSYVESISKHDIRVILKSNYDWASTKIPKLKPIGQNLYVLKIASDDFGIEGLSPKELQSILSQKFRLTKSANAISMSLMETVGKYVDRIQEGKEFLYKITTFGREYLDSLLQKVDNK